MTPPPDGAAACPACGRPLPATALHGLCGACLWGAMETTAPEDGGTGGEVLLSLPGLDVLQVIDRGGMGIVYRARDHARNRPVAVKMLLTRHGDDPAMVARFRQETQAVTGLDHPGILPVYDTGGHDGLPFFTMKLAEGGSLAERSARYAGEWRLIAQLIAGLADALHHAHSRGVLHRDVKPANMLFDAAGRAYLSDFGLVKLVDSESALTRSIHLMGTPHYMAPEVAAQNVHCATIASDVWSLGAVLYELLARRRPFDAPGIPALLRSIVEEPPAPPDASLSPPRDLLSIAQRCLEKDPPRRYASAAALQDDLHAWLAGLPVAARPPSRRRAVRLWMRRNRALTAVTALFLAALVTGAVMLAARNRTLTRALAQEQFSRAVAFRRSGDIRLRDEALSLLTAAADTAASAAAARNEAVTLLATPGWREIRRIPWQPRGQVPVLPDFSRLVQVRDGALRLLPLEEKDGAEELIDSPEPVTDVTGAAGDMLLVTTEKDGVAATRLYDRRLRRWLRAWSGAPPVTICPQGRFVAFTAENSTDITVEDLTGALPPKTITPTVPAPAPGPFTADGRRLAIHSTSSGEVDIAGLEDGGIISTIAGPWRGDFDPTFAWRPDGITLAVAADVPDFRLWQVEPDNTWRRLGTGHMAEIYHLAWHPSGTWLATTSADGTLRLWEASRCREILCLQDSPTLVFFSEKGDRLLYTQNLSQELVLCALTPPRVVQTAELPHASPDVRRQRGPWGAALTPDGRAALVGGQNIWLLDAAAGDTLAAFSTGYIQDALIVPDGSLAFIGRPGAILSLPLFHDAADRWTTGPLKTLTAKHGGARLAWSPASGTLAATAGHSVWLHRPSAPELPPRRLDAGIAVNPVAASPDGRWVAAASLNAKEPIRIFDTTLPQAGPCFLLPAAAPYFIFSTDSRILYTAGGQVLTAYQAGTWQPLWRQETGETGVSFDRIAISGTGHLLAISLMPDGVQLRHSQDGAVLATLRPPDSRSISWLALDAEGRRLITTAPGHVVHLWDLAALHEELTARGLGFSGFLSR